MKSSSTKQKVFKYLNLFPVLVISILLLSSTASAQVMTSGGAVDIKNLGEWTKMADIVIKETSKNDIKGSLTFPKHDLVIELPEGFSFDLTRIDISYANFGNITSVLIDRQNLNPRKLILTANIHSGNFNTLDEVTIKKIYIKADQSKLYTLGEYDVTGLGSFPGFPAPRSIGKVYMQAKPMPVELLYLTAEKRDNQVVLQWATATEENNTGFEVQVSQDGSNFNKLAFVETKNGNSSKKQVYQYTDTENGKFGTRYYRLKQIDNNGDFTYYNTKAVNFGEVSFSVNIYPNPFKEDLKINISTPNDEDMRLSVLSSQGKLVTDQILTVGKGLNSYDLNLDPSLSKGLYFVSVAIGNKVDRFKVLKE